IAAGTADNTAILCRCRASYQNATGAPLLPEMVVTTVRVRAPGFDPQLRPLQATAEHGDVVLAKLFANNTGSGTARQAWSNWTLGGNFRFAYLEENLPVTNVSDGFQVTWSNLAPGAHSLTAHLVVLRGMADGLSMTIQTQWTATDKNGNRLGPSTPTRSVDLLAPSFTLGMTASAVQLNTTSRFVLTLTVRNAGHAAGVGWLNTTLPSGPAFLSDNGSMPRSNQGRRYSWTIPSLAPGGALVLGITFGSALDASVASFVFMLEFTDGKGSPSASACSRSSKISSTTPSRKGPRTSWDPSKSGNAKSSSSGDVPTSSRSCTAVRIGGCSRSGSGRCLDSSTTASAWNSRTGQATSTSLGASWPSCPRSGS